MKKNVIKKIFISIKSHTLFRDAFRHLYITKKSFKLLNIFLPFVKVDETKIVFCSYCGLGFSCNPKYIALELLKRDIRKKFSLIWLIDFEKVKEVGQFPPEIVLVDYCSFRAFFELASAKVWIDNCRKFLYPCKRKRQLYFQTWHGSLGGIKKVEKDAEDKLPSYYVKTAKHDSEMIDYCISNSKFLNKLYTESFWYSGKILEYGWPRNDLLVNNSNYDIIKQNLSLSLDYKIILYAPTFRNSNSFDVYKINYDAIINAIKQKFGNKWYFLIRLHPNLYRQSRLLQIPEWVINVTMYPDVQELLGITDVLISDYSSTMFDYMFTRKPVFIYAADYDSYKDERGVYFSIDKIPFLMAENNDQLVNNILSFNAEAYNEKLDDFIRLTGAHESGNASKLVVDEIYNKINNTDMKKISLL
jgi:CDP-glycerol glycerophosphotransferase